MRGEVLHVLGCCGKWRGCYPAEEIPDDYHGANDQYHACFGNSISIQYIEDLTEVASKRILASHASLIMLDIINAGKNVKSMPICLLPTCNTFKTTDIMKLLKKIIDVFDEVCKEEKIYNFLLSIYSSDGDSRRRSLQLGLNDIRLGANKKPLYKLNHEMILTAGHFRALCNFE